MDSHIYGALNLIVFFLVINLNALSTQNPKSSCTQINSKSVLVALLDSHYTELLEPDDVIRPDELIHGIERLLVPRSLQEDFNRRRSLSSISAVLPEGAPVVDPRIHRLKKPGTSDPAGAPPALLVYDTLAPGPSLAPTPAPGTGGPCHHFDDESRVKDFIQTLLHYGKLAGALGQSC